MEGIQILPYSPLQQERTLWNEGNAPSEQVQANVFYVDPIDFNGALPQLNHSE